VSQPSLPLVVTKQESAGGKILKVIAERLKAEVLKRKEENVRMMEDAKVNFHKEMPLSLRIEKF